jgi:hypothetical protein
MCDDIEIGTENPKGVGEAFLTDSGYIHCWVNFTDVVGPVAIKFEWIDPDQEFYGSDIVYTVSGTFPLFSVHNVMIVGGTRAASKPGKWTVKVYMDDVYVAETDFYLVTQGTIFEIGMLETSLENITTLKDQILSQYISLQGDYYELIHSYDNLTYYYNLTLNDYNERIYQLNDLDVKYDNLTSEYEEVNKRLIQLQSNYDNLLIDYTNQVSARTRASLEIESELENTRDLLLLFISIIFFLLFLVLRRKDIRLSDLIKRATEGLRHFSLTDRIFSGSTTRLELKSSEFFVNANILA